MSGNHNSLRDVHNAMLQVEQEKVAAHATGTGEGDPFEGANPGLVKQAAEYYEVGANMARRLWNQLVSEEQEKQAAEQPDQGAEVEEDEKLANAKVAILNRMAEDPEYAAQLLQKHAHLLNS